MLLSHKETVVSILGLSLTLSLTLTWPGQLCPVLCASLWSGPGGNTAGVSMETAPLRHCNLMRDPKSQTPGCVHADP